MTYSYDTHFDRESIRRQFRMSMGLIVAMALAKNVKSAPS